MWHRLTVTKASRHTVAMILCRIGSSVRLRAMLLLLLDADSAAPTGLSSDFVLSSGGLDDLETHACVFNI